MTYNPIFDLVTGLVLIIVPLIILVGMGIGLLVSRGHPSTAESRFPGIEQSILRDLLNSIESLHAHQEKLYEEMRDVSEENRVVLQTLREETENLRSLVRKAVEVSEKPNPPYVGEAVIEHWGSNGGEK